MLSEQSKLAQCFQENQQLRQLCGELQKSVNDMQRAVSRLELEFKGADDKFPIDPWGLRSKLKSEVLRLLMEDTELSRRLNQIDQSNLKNSRQFQHSVDLVEESLQECKSYIRTQQQVDQQFQDLKLQLIELNARCDKNQQSFTVLTNLNKELQASQTVTSEQVMKVILTLDRKLNHEDMFTIQESMKQQYISQLQWKEWTGHHHDEIVCLVECKADVNETRDLAALVAQLERRQESITEREVLRHLKEVVERCVTIQYATKNDIAQAETRIQQLAAMGIGAEIEKHVEGIKKQCGIKINEQKLITDKEIERCTDLIRALQKRQNELLDYIRTLDQQQIGKTQLQYYDTQINIVKAHAMEVERQTHSFKGAINEIVAKQGSDLNSLKDIVSIQQSKHQNEVIVTLRNEIEELRNSLTVQKDTHTSSVATIRAAPTRHSAFSKLAVPENMASYTQTLVEELAELRQRLDSQQQELTALRDTKVGIKVSQMTLAYSETIRKQAQSLMIVFLNYLKSQSLEKNQTFIKELQQIQLWCASVSIHRGQSQGQAQQERQIERILRDAEMNGRLIERSINNMQLEHRDHSRFNRESISMEPRSKANHTTQNFYDSQNYQAHQKANQNAKIFQKHGNTKKLLPLSQDSSPH